MGLALPLTAIVLGLAAPSASPHVTDASALAKDGLPDGQIMDRDEAALASLFPGSLEVRTERSPNGALASLRRSLLSEGLLGLGVLAVVAWLGTLAPPA